MSERRRDEGGRTEEGTGDRAERGREGREGGRGRGRGRISISLSPLMDDPVSPKAAAAAASPFSSSVSAAFLRPSLFSPERERERERERKKRGRKKEGRGRHAQFFSATTHVLPQLSPPPSSLPPERAAPESSSSSDVRIFRHRREL